MSPDEAVWNQGRLGGLVIGASAALVACMAILVSVVGWAAVTKLDKERTALERRIAVLDRDLRDHWFRENESLLRYLVEYAKASGEWLNALVPFVAEAAMPPMRDQLNARFHAHGRRMETLRQISFLYSDVPASVHKACISLRGIGDPMVLPFMKSIIARRRADGEFAQAVLSARATVEHIEQAWFQGRSH